MSLRPIKKGEVRTYSSWQELREHFFFLKDIYGPIKYQKPITKNPDGTYSVTFLEDKEPGQITTSRPTAKTARWTKKGA